MKYYKVLLVLALFVPATAFSTDMSFSLNGYYRNRVVLNQNLDLQKSDSSLLHQNNRFDFISYNQMRLRTKPSFKFGDHLSLHGEVDFLDNIVYGSKDTRQLEIISPPVGTMELPPGAGSMWMTGGASGENGAINVRRIWMDVFTPVGKFRIGRQPSNWGLGIFQNDGEARQSDFGDTADRIMYLLQIDMKDAGAFTAGLIWDIAYEAQFDPRIDGLDTPPLPNSQDTQQYALMLMYERPEVTVGLFGGLRRRNGPEGATTMFASPVPTDPRCSDPKYLINGVCTVPAGIDGNTFIYFGDLYAKYQYEEYRFQFEGAYIGGKITTGLAIDAIPFSVLSSGGIIDLPAEQKMQAFLAAFEADAAYDWGGAWKVWSGYASGDSDPLSTKITMFGFRPDYQIALMMFNMPLGTSPSLWDKSGNKLTGGNPITGNYINNALYFAAGYKHTFDISNAVPGCDWLSVGGKVITAWAPKKNINLDFAQIVGQADLPEISETADSIFKRWYGVEVDLSTEAQFWEHLFTSLDFGILIPGREYDINVNLIPRGTVLDTIQPDKASMGWMARLTMMLEF